MNLLNEKMGAVIVPAYIADKNSIINLKNAISTIPPFFGLMVVIIQSNDYQMLALDTDFESFNQPIYIKIGNKMGKWPAVKAGISKLKGGEEWIAVFDGDGAFLGTDLEKMLEPIFEKGYHHVIGERHNALGQASDQISSNTRIFLEAFYNTLTLYLLDLHSDSFFHNFDIQCGFHAFSKEIWKSHLNRSFSYYGGELDLFYNTIRMNKKVINVRIHENKTSLSSYNISDIISELNKLSFVQSASLDDFHFAMKLAPKLYSNWIKNRISFEKEITTLVIKNLVNK